MFLVKTDWIRITKTQRKSKTLIFRKEGRNLYIIARLTFMTHVSRKKGKWNKNKNVNLIGKQLNPIQRYGVLTSEGPVHLVREVMGSSSLLPLPAPKKQPRAVWSVPTLREELLRERQWKGQEGKSRRRKGAGGRLSIRKRIWLPTAKHPAKLALRRSGPVVPTHWATEQCCSTLESGSGKQEHSVMCVRQ